MKKEKGKKEEGHIVPELPPAGIRSRKGGNPVPGKGGGKKRADSYLSGTGEMVPGGKEEKGEGEKKGEGDRPTTCTPGPGGSGRGGEKGEGKGEGGGEKKKKRGRTRLAVTSDDECQLLQGKEKPLSGGHGGRGKKKERRGARIGHAYRPSVSSAGAAPAASR